MKTIYPPTKKGMKEMLDDFNAETQLSWEAQEVDRDLLDEASVSDCHVSPHDGCECPLHKEV